MKRRSIPQNQAPHIFIYNYIICDMALSRGNDASRQETSDTSYVIDRGYLSEGCDVWSCDRVMWSGGGKRAGGEGAANTRVLLSSLHPQPARTQIWRVLFKRRVFFHSYKTIIRIGTLSAVNIWDFLNCLHIHITYTMLYPMLWSKTVQVI